MPTLGSTLIHGKRFNPINQKLYRAFVKETGIDLEYKDFKKIIETNNDLIGKAVSEEPEGIQLPLLGYVCVSKYKQRKGNFAVDHVASSRQKKAVPFLNLHSFGYIHYIKWFKIGCTVSNSYVWKFQPLRKVKRGLAKEIKSGKQFFVWTASDLWHSSKLERMLSKKCKQED